MQPIQSNPPQPATKSEGQGRGLQELLAHLLSLEGESVLTRDLFSQGFSQGDVDLLRGHMGEEFRYKVSPEGGLEIKLSRAALESAPKRRRKRDQLGAKMERRISRDPVSISQVCFGLGQIIDSWGGYKTLWSKGELAEAFLSLETPIYVNPIALFKALQDIFPRTYYRDADGVDHLPTRYRARASIDAAVTRLQILEERGRG